MCLNGFHGKEYWCSFYMLASPVVVQLKYVLTISGREGLSYIFDAVCFTSSLLLLPLDTKQKEGTIKLWTFPVGYFSTDNKSV